MHSRFIEVFTAVKIQVKVVWVVTPRSGPCCLSSPWRWRQQVPLKCWYPTATLHGVTVHNTSNCII